VSNLFEVMQKGDNKV